MGVCEKCKKETPRWKRCDDCLQCDDCGTREGVCTYVEGVWCDECRVDEVGRQIARFSRSRESTSGTTQCICPWCGQVQTDAWEFSDGEQECGNCELTFELETDTVVYYSTVRIGTQAAARK